MTDLLPVPAGRSEEIVPDVLVEVVYDPELGALHKFSQPRPGALRIVHLGGDCYMSVPLPAAGEFHTHDEDRFRSPLETLFEFGGNPLSFRSFFGI
jgi:hypothetical protein